MCVMSIKANKEAPLHSDIFQLSAIINRNYKENKRAYRGKKSLPILLKMQVTKSLVLKDAVLYFSYYLLCVSLTAKTSPVDNGQKIDMHKFYL